MAHPLIEAWDSRRLELKRKIIAAGISEEEADEAATSIVRREIRRTPFVSDACRGARCCCGEPAQHKVEEVILFDDPLPGRHPLTAYVCHDHFRQMMGPQADA